jgi:RNA polymerase sigma factor (sigma-70 family)
MITLDPVLVVEAGRGSRAALEALVLSLQRPIFNLALRMLASRPDAEDATQEILVRIVTHLGEVRDTEAAGAWAFRIACRHLVHARRRSRIESQRLAFRAFAADLADGLQDLPDEAARDPETQRLIEEVKIGCTLALLTCLSRPLRAAYVLGEIFELAEPEAAFALDVAPAAFRQRLKRARALVTGFVQANCGIISPSAACRCDRRLARAISLGRIERGQPSAVAGPDIASIRASIAALERGRAATALMRSNPSFATEIGRRVLAAIEGG